MRTVIGVFLIAVSVSSSSQPIRFSDEASKITFTIRNFGLTVDGTIKGLSGQFILHEDTIPKSYFRATVRSETIDTGVSLRDKHLQGKNYFNSDKFPTIKIESSKITMLNGMWQSVATLTIKGVSKSIDLPFVLVKHDSVFAFKGTFTMHRRDFDIGGNSLSLSDSVDVRIEVKGATVNSFD